MDILLCDVERLNESKSHDCRVSRGAIQIAHSARAGANRNGETPPFSVGTKQTSLGNREANPCHRDRRVAELRRSAFPFPRAYAPGQKLQTISASTRPAGDLTA
jgi:hypothetical protein